MEGNPILRLFAGLSEAMAGKKIHTPRYSGSDLRRLRKERGVGRPMTKKRLERKFAKDVERGLIS